MPRLHRWRTLSLLTVILVLIGNWTHTFAADTTTTFYVVRHAERPTGIDSDRLTFLGAQRAEALRRLLHAVPLAAIYSTDTRRTWETGTPTAIAAGIAITPYGKPGDDLDVWVREWKENYKGKNVLIVGHSNTVPLIVQQLNNDQGHFEFEEHEYDNLFIVKMVEDHHPDVQWRRYSVLETLSPVDFNGNIHEEKDISAIAATNEGRFLITGSDEGTEIQIIEVSDREYHARDTITLRDRDKKEIDIEGITRHGNTNIFYAVGSHSLRRKNIFRKKDQEETYRKIKKRFEVESPDREKNREHLIRFELDPHDGTLVPHSIVDISLRDILDQHSVLKHFSRIPSKENGIDIEGIASDGENVYLGFRGPVLRHGLTPVVVFPRKQVVTPPQKITHTDVRYVKLDGRGIRDITRVEGGFLVIAGPVGNAPVSYNLYFWNGHDCLPGKRASEDPPRGEVVMLGTIPTPGNSKAEAILLLNEQHDNEFYEILICYDGVERGNPTRFRVSHPRRLYGNMSRNKEHS
ncbi:MAG: hypothetical protein NPIRA05_10540 [Nitrospirales bacterium]|nr:MAG: hypothetical protein NPIRA05_10540 [Nitrospirales bacterium]